MRRVIKFLPRLISPRERKIVLENFLSLSTLQAITYVLPVVVIPYLIRVIGPAKFGLIAFAQAFIQYFMLLTDYGFSFSATRQISLYRQQKKKICNIFSAVMSAKIILACISFVILILAINFIPRFRNDWQIYVFSFGAVIGNTLFPVWFFQGKEKMRYIAAINIAGGLIYTVCVFIFVRNPEDYLYVPILNSLFFLVTGISGLYLAFKRFGLEFVVQKYANIRDELKTGWDIFISILAINGYTATRVFAVGLLTNNTLTGYYSIAEKIAYVAQSFPLISFSQAIYPRLNKIYAKSKKRALRILNKVQNSTTLSFAIAIPILIFLSPWLVKIVCGVAYKEAVISLRLLLISVFFVGANALKVQYLLVSARPQIYSRIHIWAAVAGLPLIFFFIAEFSYLGAAIATILIEALVLIATYQATNTSYHKHSNSVN